MGVEDQHVVSVFGSGEISERNQAFVAARAVGRRLAEWGYVLANGGYGGTMEASARGAAEAGGQVIGVTCSVWSARPNRFITRQVRTENVAERVGKLIELGRCGYICLPGSTGTLLELASVWELINKRFLPRRPLVCLGEFWRPLIDLMVSHRPASGQLIDVAETPDDLAAYFPPRA